MGGGPETGLPGALEGRRRPSSKSRAKLDRASVAFQALGAGKGGDGTGLRAQLLGAELWLRAEEVNGSRVLNHRFVVEQ